VISQIPQLILEVHHAEIEDVILVVVNTAAKFVNDAVVCLACLIGDVPGADQKVTVGAKTLVNVMQFGTDYERSLFSETAARTIGIAHSQRGLTKYESAQAKIRARGKPLVPAAGIVLAARWRIFGRIIDCRIKVGLDQRIQPVNVYLTAATLDRGHYLGIRSVRQYRCPRQNCES